MTAPLVVCLLTYEGPGACRTEYAVRTAMSLRANLPSIDPVHWHLADDGSSASHVEAVTAAATSVAWPYDGAHPFGRWTRSDSERRGYAANVNAAMRRIHQEHGRDCLVLLVEDDWELRRPLQVGVIAQALAEHEHWGCVRLGYVGITRPLRATFVGTSDGHEWLELDRRSEEPYVFTGHPRLEHGRFWEPWPEQNGARPGDCEGLAGKMYRERAAGPRREIVWPVDFCPASQGSASLFHHIGTLRSFE